jgi:hypothetical protein
MKKRFRNRARAQKPAQSWTVTSSPVPEYQRRPVRSRLKSLPSYEELSARPERPGILTRLFR